MDSLKKMKYPIAASCGVSLGEKRLTRCKQLGIKPITGIKLKMRESLKQNLVEPIYPYGKTPFTSLNITGDSLRSVGEGVHYPQFGKLESSDDFFRFQKETSETIDLIKNQAVSEYLLKLRKCFPEFNEEALHIHHKRIGNVKLRGVHSRVYICALGGIDDCFTPRVAAAIEFLLDDMYYLNQFFDSKSGLISTKNIISAVHSNSMLWPLIIPSSDDQLKKQEVFGAISEDINNIISGFYYGEYIDCLFNTWDKLKNASLEEQLASCNKRIYYIDALFFQAIANIAGKVVSIHQEKESDKSRLAALCGYAANYGMGLQIINDLADFVPPELNPGTSEKMSTDAYSDIRNGKMSYPIIVMLEMASSEDRDKIVTCLEKGFGASEEELRKTTDVLLQSGAYSECRAICREYKKNAKAFAREFPKLPHLLLSYSSVILDSNRYYKALHSLDEKLIG